MIAVFILSCICSFIGGVVATVTVVQVAINNAIVRNW